MVQTRKNAVAGGDNVGLGGHPLTLEALLSSSPWKLISVSAENSQGLGFRYKPARHTSLIPAMER